MRWAAHCFTDKITFCPLPTTTARQWRLYNNLTERRHTFFYTTYVSVRKSTRDCLHTLKTSETCTSGKMCWSEKRVQLLLAKRNRFFSVRYILERTVVICIVHWKFNDPVVVNKWGTAFFRQNQNVRFRQSYLRSTIICVRP